MDVRIVCFEDSERDRRLVEKIFLQKREGSSGYATAFLFFADPESEWEVTPERAGDIALFRPDFAIVDIIHDQTNLEEGFRTIRQLREAEATRNLPIVAWSIGLRNDRRGLEIARRVKAGGALPLFKNRKRPPSAERFIRLVGRGDLLEL